MFNTDDLRCADAVNDNLRATIAELAEALQIVLTQIGPYKDGDGSAKYHAVNIGQTALRKATQ